MILQGSGLASTFQMEDETFALAPSDSHWSDPDLPISSLRGLEQFRSLAGAQVSESK
jgi:hypothetical protein